MHRLGIEPGSIALQATIVPLTHRCVISIFYALIGFLFSAIYAVECFCWWRIFVCYLGRSLTFLNLRVESCIFFKKIKLASGGNRTLVYRVAGDNSTTEPPMSDSYILRSHWFSVQRYLCCRVFLLVENFFVCYLGRSLTFLNLRLEFCIFC